MSVSRDKHTAIENSGLRPRTRLVLHALVRRENWDTGLIPDLYQPSLVRLEKVTGLRHETLLRELNRAENTGWLKRDRGKGGRGHRTRYTVTVPQRGPDAAPFPAVTTGPDAEPFQAGKTGPVPPGNRSDPGTETGPHAGPQLIQSSTGLSPGDLLAGPLPDISPDEREDLAAWIIEQNAVRNPRAYLPTLSADDLRGHLADLRQQVRNRPGSAGPPWCGNCDPQTRMREQEPDGRPYRCPECHAARENLGLVTDRR
jgi:hypothetical protein